MEKVRQVLNGFSQRLEGLRRRDLRWAGAVVFLLMLVTGFGWSLASPVSGSPDDDHHLASTWCPMPVESYCNTKMVGDILTVEVPEAIGQQPVCYQFHGERSAACVLEYQDTETHFAGHYNRGIYPGGFYLFHHQLVGEDPEISVVLMRCVNVLLISSLVFLLWACAPRRLKAPIALAAIATWTPMGVYFIASNNPSSWSIGGLFIYAVGVYAATLAAGWRRWTLLGAGAGGALLCMSARFDVSFYLFVVSLALAFAVPWCRARWPEALTALTFGLAGPWWTSYGFSRVWSLGPEAESASPADVRSRLFESLFSAPKYLGGFYGAYWQPGWIDVSLNQFAPFFLGILALGGYVSLGMRHTTWRTWLAVGTVVGALWTIPAVFYARGVFNDVFSYQARYIMPLLAVALFLLLAVGSSRKGRLGITLPQGIWLGLCAVFGHGMTLHSVMYRYVHGMFENEYLDLNYGVTWWWTTSLRPMTVWVLATLAYTLVVAAVMVSARWADASSSPEPEAAAPERPHSLEQAGTTSVGAGS